MISRFFGAASGIILCVLIAFGIFQWLHIPAGNFTDWLIGISMFCWLLIITTVPWNVYFRAKEVLSEAEQSQDRGIAIDTKQVNYVTKVAQRSLLLALGLHVISATVMYSLAIAGISSLGYIGSVSALLLTLLRPSVRAYEYLAMRLASIQQKFAYPREDIWEVRQRLSSLEESVNKLKYELNLEEPNSWAAKHQRYGEETRQEIAQLKAMHREMSATNQQEHERLSREAQQAISQLTVDSKFLDNVREIIRFFKSA